MEDRTRTLIVTGAILLIIAAIIIGTIYFITRFFQNRTASSPRVSPSPRVVVSVSPVPNATVQPSIPGGTTGGVTNTPQDSGTKSYQNNYYSLNYPQNWGILTCSNSANVELDPASPQEAKGVVCDYAVKPVTIVAQNNLSCQGEQLTLGNYKVVRSVDGSKGGQNWYKWCVEGGVVDMEITHRVSNGGDRATSLQDYAKQIEQQLIPSIKFPQSS